MAKVNFTASRVSSFKCPEGKAQAFLWDTGAPGLALRVTTAGARAYIFQGTFQGKSLRVTIGSPDAWSIPKAQEKARELQRHIDEGRDPRAVKAERAAADVARRESERQGAITVGEAWKRYLLEGRPKRKDDWKPRYRADMEKMAAPGGVPKKRGQGLTQPGHLAPLMALALKDITPRRLKAWHRKEELRSRVQAARAVQMFSGFLRWCSTQEEYAGLVDADAARDPLIRDDLPSNTENARTDAVEAEQLAAWFAGTEKLPNRTAAVFLRALLLTGARREEMAALKWSDVDFRWKRMTIADKVGSTRVIPLCPYLEAQLKSLLPVNGYVFASRSKSGRIAEPRSAHEAVLQDAALPHVTIHGLRRSFALLGEAAGCPAGAIAQVMGHRPGSMSERYKPRSIDVLRKLLAQVERFILECAGIEFSPEQAEPGIIKPAFKHKIKPHSELTHARNSV